MASALTDRERWRGIQLGTGGSSLSTSLANCSLMPASYADIAADDEDIGFRSFQE